MSAIVADLTTVIERMFDRWENAFAAARAYDYTPGEMAKDMAEGWMDAAYLSMLASARLSGLELQTTETLPIARFIVTDKTVDVTQVIRVYRNGTTKENLTRAGGFNIPNAHYNVTMAVDGRRYLYVKLLSPTVPAGTGAGVYAGNVTNGAGGPVVARVVVVWPG
jgi:hypothetical protein